MTALASDAGRAKGGIVPILLCVVPFSQILWAIHAADQGQQPGRDRPLGLARVDCRQRPGNQGQFLILGDEQAQASHLGWGEPIHQVVHVLVVVCSGHSSSVGRPRGLGQPDRQRFTPAGMRAVAQGSPGIWSMSPRVFLPGTSPGGPFTGEGGPRASGRCPRQYGSARTVGEGAAERVRRWGSHSPLEAVPATALGKPARRT